MVRVDEVRPGERMTEPKRQRMGGVTANQSDGAKDPETEAAGVAPNARRPSERDELAIDMPGERTAQLERIALSAPKMPAGPKSVGAT